LKIWIITNLNSKFVGAFTMASLEDLQAYCREHTSVGQHWRQVGANTWQAGETNPETGLIRPKQWVFRYDLREVPETFHLKLAA
jgi:hypothetical protein